MGKPLIRSTADIAIRKIRSLAIRKKVNIVR